MPIHDWSRVYSGLFHDFHQSWSIYIRNALNAGLLPEGITALIERKRGRRNPMYWPLMRLLTPNLPTESW